MENLYLLAFGTFGHPNDFRQTVFIGSDKSIAKSIKTFDLNINAIKIFPKSNLYSIRKENVNGLNSIAYSIYSYAKEQNSEREGTFIGASILFINEICEENITLSRLKNFHSGLVGENIKNNVLLVSHSKDFIIPRVVDFDKIEMNKKELERINYSPTNVSLVVLARIDNNTLQRNFKKSLGLLNRYDTIYFTDNKEIVDFTRNRNVYATVDESGFEREIQNVEEEKKKKTQVWILELEKDKEDLELDKHKSISEFKQKILETKELHQENQRRIDQSQTELKLLNQKYEDFKKNIDDSIRGLKQDKCLEEVKELHNTNKKRFLDSIMLQSSLSFVRAISKTIPRTELRTSSQNNSYDYNKKINKPGQIQSEEDTGKTFKILSGLLLLLWIGTMVYFCFFNNKEDRVELYQAQDLPTKVNEKPMDVEENMELNPVSNNYLDEKGRKLVLKKIKKDMSINEIVNIIFANNPKDIAQLYVGQEKEYAEQLQKLNKDCFFETRNVFYLKSDSLKTIPSFKK